MKDFKWIVTAGLMLVAATFTRAQQEPTYEEEGDKVRVTHYYDSGKVKETGTFANGKRDGKWVQFNEEGQMTCEAYFTKGVKDGTWLRWEDKGSILYEIVYNENELAHVRKWKIEERNMLAGE